MQSNDMRIFKRINRVIGKTDQKQYDKKSISTFKINENSFS